MPGSLKDFDEWLAKGGHITELEGLGTDHPASTALSCAVGEAAMMIGSADQGTASPSDGNQEELSIRKDKGIKQFLPGYLPAEMGKTQFQIRRGFKAHEFESISGILPLGVWERLTSHFCVCVCRYSTVCWYLGPQGQPNPTECCGVFVGSGKESICIHSGKQT